jgi:hypothetical protein
VNSLPRWIRTGLQFSTFFLVLIHNDLQAEEPKLGEWAFAPLTQPMVPNVKGSIQTPIDAFILGKLHSKGLSFSTPADRKTLARRIFIDLIGVPPTPEQVHSFCNDPSPDAYEKLVDRLLADPRYGERWARHWLDVVHYADSHGHDQDRPRENAWPYRDYLIRAFNSDKPYSQFVREQIAGDAIEPLNPDAIAATGFLAAGPWDESGLRDIREDSFDRLAAQNLDRDDLVTTTMSTFMGLTVHCARCHDHKFDPISQVDYYSIQAVFAGIDKAERAYDADATVAIKRKELQERLVRLKSDSKSTVKTEDQETHVKLQAWEKDWRARNTSWTVPESIKVTSQHGSIFQKQPDQSFLCGGKRPDKDVYQLELKTPLNQVTGLRLEVLTDPTLPHLGPGRQDNGNLHLSEVRVSAAGRPIKILRAVADFDQDAWDISKTIDGNPGTAWGIYPQVGKPHQATFEFEQPIAFPPDESLRIELDQLHGAGHLIGRFRVSLTADQSIRNQLISIPQPIQTILGKSTRSEMEQAEMVRWFLIQEVEDELRLLPAQSKVYCGTNQFKADGSFRPSSKARPIHVLKRGELKRPQQLVAPGAISVLKYVTYQVNRPDEEANRRLALAKWLTDPKNPLLWRVIVNRVWHYHFGRGIVDTPNDFGKMGGIPSHPELLDWLAISFRDSGGSIKQLHRMILLSNVYQQQVQLNPTATAVDADNRLLWRMNRSRLDAETIRDTVLHLTGRLDQQFGGAPVKHFQMKPGIHVTPEADYLQFDVDSIESRRRSIYRFIFRTKPDPMLAALDCPDASQSAPVRQISVSAPQALVLWNNQFLLRHAEHFAEGISKSARDETQQIQLLCQRLLLREATQSELSIWLPYVQKHGLVNLTRVLLNSSEFLFVD